MLSAQIERLQKDSDRLDRHIEELKESGKKEVLQTVIDKRRFLETKLAEISPI